MLGHASDRSSGREMWVRTRHLTAGVDSTIVIHPCTSQQNRSNSRAIRVEHAYQDGTIDYMRNFLACVKSRRESNALVEVGATAVRAGHIGNLTSQEEDR